jgi:hypothetical protein
MVSSVALNTMTPTEYPAAQAASVRIHSHFARHLAITHQAADKLGTLPDADTLATIIDAAFWASLRREEGYSPRISLAFVAPDQVLSPLRFERSLPLAPQPLTKVAAAAERPGIHLCVWREQEELRVWGATRSLPALCFVLEVIAPGHLVIKQSRTEESGKFINVAVLQGDEIKVIDPRATSVPDCPALLTSLLRLESQFSSGSDVNVLIQLAVSMRAHGRGGTLLVTPADTQEWKESILHPITYSVVPPFSALADLLQNGIRTEPNRHWEDALARAVDGVAGLTAVDGATLITEKYELLAFGAKIVLRRGCSQVGRVIVTEPIEDAKAVIAEPAQLGGTRHLSAAQFVNDQRDAIALVASQDGRFTVFAWSSCEEMVHAHRIDTLLI